VVLILTDLELINTQTQAEHKKWVESNIPAFIKNVPTISAAQYSIHDYPKLWSGARFLEAKITQTSIDLPASKAIEKLIARAKWNCNKNSAERKQIEAFEKDYAKQLHLLIERFLRQSIDKTLSLINGIDSNTSNEYKAHIHDLLSSSSLLNLQTHYQCLQAHKKAGLLCLLLKSSIGPENDEEHAKINQLEILTKRLLDCHYKSAKKLTLGEAITNDISTTTSLIGLITGVPAALLAIGSLFFPPLLLPAGILGIISYTSYIASGIYAVQIAYEALGFDRAPDPALLKELIWDLALLPLMLFSGAIVSAICNITKPTALAQKIITAGQFLWDNIITNIFPDILTGKRTFLDTLKIGTFYTDTGTLKHTTTATSWKKIRSALTLTSVDTITQVRKTKEVIQLSDKYLSSSPLFGRGFVFTRLEANSKSLSFTNSFHAHILMWDKGFYGFGKSALAQKIIDAVQDYKQLKPDAPNDSRLKMLSIIKDSCDIYLEKYKNNEKKGRYSFVEKLYEKVDNEIHNLTNFIAANEENPAILVTFKAN